MRYPFLKLQLLSENPCAIPDAHEWPAVLLDQAPSLPSDLIAGMQLRLKGVRYEDQAAAAAVDVCDAARAMQLHVACYDAPPAPLPLPSAELIGLEDGSIIPAEAAIAVRVFVNHAHDVAALCGAGSAEVVSANVLVEVYATNGSEVLAAYAQKIVPDKNFYSFKLPLRPGDYSIASGIASAACPDLITQAFHPFSISVVSNQQLLHMQPHRVRMAVVDQIEHNACLQPHEFDACTGFTMHGDLGYVGPPRHALLSRHVAVNDTVIFFYQWGINKASLFSGSVLKVLVAMESRAAEETMWRYIDNLQFDTQPPPFDYVLTHDRALLQRALLRAPPVCFTSMSSSCRHAAGVVCAAWWSAAAAQCSRYLSQDKLGVHGKRASGSRV